MPCNICNTKNWSPIICLVSSRLPCLNLPTPCIRYQTDQALPGLNTHSFNININFHTQTQSIYSFLDSCLYIYYLNSDVNPPGLSIPTPWPREHSINRNGSPCIPRLTTAQMPRHGRLCTLVTCSQMVCEYRPFHPIYSVVRILTVIKENGERRGSNAFNVPTTSAFWGTTSLATRSPSTSPSRMAQDHIPNSDLGNDQSLAGHFSQMGISKERSTAVYGNAFRYDSDPFNGFGRTQDHRSSSSRQSQSSPSYRAAHTASKSTQSQQQFPNHIGQGSNHQALNQKAFNHNNSQSMDATSFNLLGNMSSAFAFDPNCQPWNNDASGQRVNGNSLDLSSEMMNAQASTMHRGSIDRLSNLTDQVLNTRANPQIWNQVYSARPVDQGLRMTNQVNQLAAQSIPYYSHQLAMFSEPNAPYTLGLDQYPQRYHQLGHNNSGYGAPYPYHNQNSGPGPKIYKNQWVKEFCGRLTKRSGPQPELCEAYGHMVDASGEQESSRWLQTKLAVATNEEKTRILLEIADDARTVMICSFGNYVMQNLIEYTGQGEKYHILQQMKGHVNDLARNKHGCRVVQKVRTVISC